VPSSVPVDHVEYYCHAVAVGCLDKAPEGAAVAKALIHTEEPNRFKALIDRALDIGNRHDLEAIKWKEFHRRASFI
jgi:hypothetical protein